MKHYTVYKENGIYAGWPANHGAWQRGDEFLVGFLRGSYRGGAGHHIMPPYEKMQARSLDGGLNWKVEKPNVDFECDHFGSSAQFSLDNSIIRVCGCYDTGGEKCYQSGGFYLSNDFGLEWNGPFSFNGLEHIYDEGHENSSRTCVLSVESLVFLSVKERFKFGTDKVFCAKHNGERFEFLSWVCNDEYRAVMPAVTMVGCRIVTVIRRRSKKDRWIDAFRSDDNGKSWQFLSFIDDAGQDNGNPPALVSDGDTLFCTYGNRDKREICIAISHDGGLNWDKRTLRDRGETDIGYPRLFRRNGGSFVCAYYWAPEKCYWDSEDVPLREQRIECTHFSIDDFAGGGRI